MADLPQSATSFDALYEQARQSDKAYGQYVERFLENLKTRHPGKFDDVRFEQAPLKTPERAREKISKDYGGNAA